MLLEEFKGKRIAGYGCLVGNVKKKPEDTVSYLELIHNFGLEPAQIHIDMVLVNVKKRPVLNQLLESLEQHDRVYISDISDLLGVANKAREYYKKALEKGIELYITDLTHTLYHVHPLSTLLPKSSKPVKLDVDYMLEEFDKYVESYVPVRRLGRKKCYINCFTLEWKKLYFDYESYQIDLEAALERAKAFGVNNYPTFVNMIADYERSIDYHDDSIDYARKDTEFINLPKRIVKRAKGSYILPEEFVSIREKAKQAGIEIIIDSSNFDKEGFISQTGEEMNFLINNVIYKRYQNLETMKIPRKLRGVNIHF